MDEFPENSKLPVTLPPLQILANSPRLPLYIFVFDDRLTITLVSYYSSIKLYIHIKSARKKEGNILCCRRSFWFLPVHEVYHEESPNQRSLQLLSNEVMKKMKFKLRQ